MAGSLDGRVTGVSTDTRTLKKGDLFFALKGKRFDGERYARAALRRGAVGVVVRSVPWRGRRSGSGGCWIRVPDPLKGLGDLAAAWRDRFSIPVVAVTGSNGKTTTKEMIAKLLSSRYRVLKTEGNLNNRIGLPLTLFRLNRRHQVAVLEMGMSVPGEIRRLARIARPQVGVITNIGRAHLKGVGGMAGVARAKGELLRELPRKGGLAVIPQEGPFVSLLKRRISSPRKSFGWSRGAALQCLKVRDDGLRGTRFWVRFGGRSYPFSLKLPGRHNIENGMAALAVGDFFRIPSGVMARQLARVRPLAWRMEVIRGPRWILLQDSYNANPDSMKRGLEVLSRLAARRRVALLGDMLELGSDSVREHERLGVLTAGSGVDLLIGVGGFRNALRRGALQGGLPADRILLFEKGNRAAARVVRSCLKKGDLVLIKGSRGMRMERWVEEIRN